ncbi:alpha/beta hydrolase family protein [Parvularcula dongshanensis]|uniref:Dipeptidyl aminopeptidase/acylaminoacyl peptidase n=1 Tax=Parvularcula dongshanensis TaxID=1173995 RepID=A0A840I4R9_9PROT|nr:S9 family peptidase [Parvularcula dongshanensis]MBB4659168.1 dipeptidyl aminopeptidase/acylaminoacyl peptidase [Parvularcula dongshanensis]
MICACIGAAFAAVAAAAPSASLGEDVDAFGRMPTLRHVSVSPSGNRVAALYRDGGAEEYSFIVFEYGDQFQMRYAGKQNEQFRVSEPHWMRDDRIVFSVRFGAMRHRTDTVETRLMSLDVETGEIIPLFDAEQRQGVAETRGSIAAPVQIQDRIVSLTRQDPDSLLVQYWNGDVYGKINHVYEVDVDRTKRHKRVHKGRDDIYDWKADELGEIRSGWGLEGGKEPRLRMLDSRGKWQDRSRRVAEDAPTFSVLGFPRAPGKAFVASAHETETAALYLYDVDSDRFEEQLFHSPVSDVYGVYQQRGTGEALGVIYAEDESLIHWFGQNFVRDAIDVMERTFPGRAVTLTDLNAEQTHAVFLVDGTNEAGSYYIFDIANRQVTALPTQYPTLEGRAMGAVVRVDYEARDGLSIPAYLTLPPGLSLTDAKDLPFVVMPHGGPTARSFAQFDWRTQFLASRGYGVLQMNFRGSSGYGEAFRKAGDRQWGQAMQDDITDGAEWLVAQGYADGDRLAIMGGSYGGYASLMGVVKTPDLYQCSVAYGAVTDLHALLRDTQRYRGGEYMTRHIGTLWSDRAMHRENSPMLRADAIKVPVLLVHGEDDRVVDVNQSRGMASALKRSGTPHRYVELPAGSHYVDVGDNRMVFLREVGSFLSECLGGPEERADSGAAADPRG